MEDLLALTEHLLKKINNRQHTSKRHIADKAWRRLKDYTWPGNIRELENILTRSAVLARSDTITADLLAIPVNREDPGASPGEAESSAKPARLITLDQIEREHVAAILAQMRWHKGNACEILGISRPALDREIVKCSQGAS
jgi:DNA-binding NtrC family response regulator